MIVRADLREWGDGMSVLEALVGAQDRSNQTAMRGAEFATNAWDNLVEGLVMKKAGNEILDLMQGGPVKPEQLAQVAQKYHLKMEQVGKLVELLNQSGAMAQPQKPQYFNLGPQGGVVGVNSEGNPSQVWPGMPAPAPVKTPHQIELEEDADLDRKQRAKIAADALAAKIASAANKPEKPEKITSEFDLMKSFEADAIKYTKLKDEGGNEKYTQLHVKLSPVAEKTYADKFAEYGKKLAVMETDEPVIEKRWGPDKQIGTRKKFARYELRPLRVGDRINGKLIKVIGKGDVTGKPAYLLEDGTEFRTR